MKSTFGVITQFFNEVYVELSKVVWPTYNEFVGSTIIVIFVVAIFAVYFAVVDAAVSKAAWYVFKGFGSNI